MPTEASRFGQLCKITAPSYSAGTCRQFQETWLPLDNILFLPVWKHCLGCIPNARKQHGIFNHSSLSHLWPLILHFQERKLQLNILSLWYLADTSLFCPSERTPAPAPGQGERWAAGQEGPCRGKADLYEHCHFTATSQAHGTATSTPLASINHLLTLSHRWEKTCRTNCVRKNTRVLLPMGSGSESRTFPLHSFAPIPCTHSCAKLALQGDQVLVVQARC